MCRLPILPSDVFQWPQIFSKVSLTFAIYKYIYIYIYINGHNIINPCAIYINVLYRPLPIHTQIHTHVIVLAYDNFQVSDDDLLCQSSSLIGPFTSRVSDCCASLSFFTLLIRPLTFISCNLFSFRHFKTSSFLLYLYSSTQIIFPYIEITIFCHCVGYFLFSFFIITFYTPFCNGVKFSFSFGKHILKAFYFCMIPFSVTWSGYCITYCILFAASNIEQVLEAAPHKAAAVRPPTTHHKNYQN